jgi:Tfp pilus assembly protein FimT
MELLAVMAVMGLLTTLSVTSYFGAVRSMTRRSAVTHFVNTLLLARQRACMENSRVSVVLFNDVTGVNLTDVTPSYALCKEVGRVSFVRNDRIADEFFEIEKVFGTAVYGPKYLGSIRLYNLSQGKWTDVFPWVEPYELSDRRSASGNPFMSATERTGGYSLNCFSFRTNPNVQNRNPANWEIGDPYGIEAAPVGTLPRNFIFKQLQTSTSSAITITFNPDGSAKIQGGGTVTIAESLPPNKTSTVTVNTSGKINYSGRWL